MDTGSEAGKSASRLSDPVSTGQTSATLSSFHFRRVFLPVSVSMSPLPFVPQLAFPAAHPSLTTRVCFVNRVA